MKPKQKIHPMLLFGFLMNSITLMIQHSVNTDVACFLQGVSISFVFLGLLYQIDALKKYKAWKQKHIIK